MAFAIGLAMIFAAFLIGRVAKTGGRIQPPPRWNNDDLNGFVVVPGIVTLLAAGIATDWDWVAGRGWRASSLVDALGARATGAAFPAPWGLLTAWERRVLPLEKTAHAFSRTIRARPPGSRGS